MEKEKQEEHSATCPVSHVTRLFFNPSVLYKVVQKTMGTPQAEFTNQF